MYITEHIKTQQKQSSVEISDCKDKVNERRILLTGKLLAGARIEPIEINMGLRGIQPEGSNYARRATSIRLFQLSHLS